jgi:hypothetical protein
LITENLIIHSHKRYSPPIISEAPFISIPPLTYNQFLWLKLLIKRENPFK